MQGTRDQSWTVGMLRAAARSRRQEPWLWRVSTDKLSPSYWGGWRRTCCQVGEQLIKTFYIIQFYLGIFLIPSLRFRCIFLNFSSSITHTGKKLNLASPLSEQWNLKKKHHRDRRSSDVFFFKFHCSRDGLVKFNEFPVCVIFNTKSESLTTCSIGK